jgi:hypothetical protein
VSNPPSTAQDERRVRSHLASLLPIFEIQFVQRLYVIARKCDRDKHDTLLAETRETLERVAGLWANPGARPNLGLPHKAVRICMSQAIHHSCDGSGNLEHIRIAAVDDGHWEGVRREEEHNVATILFWKFLESGFDVLGDSLVWKREYVSGH